VVAQSFVNVHHRAQAWTARGFADAVIDAGGLNRNTTTLSRFYF
jgi:hypothetical protein